MIKSRKNWYLLLALLPVLHFAVAEPNYMDAQARGVVSQYFAALSQGDTASIQQLIGGELLSTRQVLLNNPTYPEFLSNFYKDAAFTITDSNELKSGEISVSATIRLEGDEQMDMTFFLSRSERSDGLVIVREVEADKK